MANPHVTFAVIAGAVLATAIAAVAIKYFRQELADWFSKLSEPSTAQIQKQSERMLAQMDENVAKRKALKQQLNKPS